MSWFWLLIPLFILIAGGALWFAASRPGFWISVVRIIVVAMLPSIKEALKPKDFTPEERDRIKRGEPIRPRRSGTGGNR